MKTYCLLMSDGVNDEEREEVQPGDIVCRLLGRPYDILVKSAILLMYQAKLSISFKAYHIYLLFTGMETKCTV